MAENEDALRLDKLLCFPLYVCSKELTRLYNPFLDKLGLTYTQFIAMAALWEKKELNVRELGECLYLDSGTLTPMLKRLEQKGLVTRQRSKRDERSLQVRLTKQGKALQKEAASIPEAVMDHIQMTAEEQKELSDLLHKMLALMGRF